MRRIMNLILGWVKGFAIISGIIAILYFGITGAVAKRKLAKLTAEQTTAQVSISTNDQEIIKELETEVKEKNDKIKNLKQKIKNLESDIDNRYLEIKFPTNGLYYKEAFEVQYFADPECTKKISDVTFLSPEKDTGRSSTNDLPIYILRTEDGGFCYCPQTSSPYLITLEKWNEMQTE